jgi:hypothetical protein
MLVSLFVFTRSPSKSFPWYWDVTIWKWSTMKCRYMISYQGYSTEGSLTCRSRDFRLHRRISFTYSQENFQLKYLILRMGELTAFTILRLFSDLSIWIENSFENTQKVYDGGVCTYSHLLMSSIRQKGNHYLFSLTLS